MIVDDTAPCGDRPRRFARGWLVAATRVAAGHATGLVGAWRDLDPGRRGPGLAFAAATAAAGIVMLAATART